MEDNEAKIAGKIKESLDKLDGTIKVETPDLMKFVELVNDLEEKKEAAGNRQFTIFIATAILLISLEVYLFSLSFSFFSIAQALALLCTVPVIVGIRKRLRQVRKS